MSWGRVLLAQMFGFSLPVVLACLTDWKCHVYLHNFTVNHCMFTNSNQCNMFYSTIPSQNKLKPMEYVLQYYPFSELSQANIICFTVLSLLRTNSSNWNMFYSTIPSQNYLKPMEYVLQYYPFTELTQASRICFTVQIGRAHV